MLRLNCANGTFMTGVPNKEKRNLFTKFFFIFQEVGCKINLGFNAAKVEFRSKESKLLPKCEGSHRRCRNERPPDRQTAAQNTIKLLKEELSLVLTQISSKILLYSTCRWHLVCRFHNGLKTQRFREESGY